VALLACVQLLLLLDAAWDKADTPDEPRYIGGAIMQLARGDFSQYGHCPLPKWGFAVALYAVEPWIADTPAKNWREAAHIHLYKHPLPRLRRNLLAARSATILVCLLTGVVLWTTAARMGMAAGFFAQALWSFSPAVLAHGSLATLDAWTAAAVAALLLATVRLLEKPSRGRALALGGVIGLGLGVKIVTVVWLPAALLALAVRMRTSGTTGGGHRRQLAQLVATVLLAGLGSLWAVNGFSIGTVDTTALVGDFGGRAIAVGPVPFPSWIEGLLRQMAVGSSGNRNYLFGVMRKEGWWWYYLAVVAFKVTIGAQILGVLRVVQMLRWRSRASLLIDMGLLVPPAILFAVFSLSDNQTGVRYLLPMFPPLILWASRLVERGPSAPALLRGLALAALMMATAESLAVRPHWLMFFNQWAGGPEGGPRYLVDSDDWGQDQRRLAEWQRKKHLGGIFYASYTDNPRVWGIRFKPAPCTPRTGVFALQVTEVYRPKRRKPGCYDWLTVEPPDERIGYSIYIYYVNRQRRAELESKRLTTAPFFRGATGPPAKRR
jgi:hypothetical protein